MMIPDLRIKAGKSKARGGMSCMKCLWKLLKEMLGQKTPSSTGSNVEEAASFSEDRVGLDIEANLHSGGN